MMRSNRLTWVLFCALTAAGSSHAAILNSGGYTENFDSMGTSGTTPPTDWRLFTGNSGTTNATWTSSIAASGANSVASMIATTAALTAITTPTANNNNGYNAAASAGTTSDRVLATAPTTVSGAALQVALTNGTGGDLNGLVLSYDIIRYNATSSANELPGFWVFYSLDAGTTWTNVAALNPTLSGPGGVIVPNSAGVTSVVNASFSFSAPLAAGAEVRLRWVDDNAAQTSPDQIIGLNNVSVQIPTPGSAALLALGGLVGIRRRR